MGKHVNRRFTNVIGWITVVVLIALSLMLLISSFFPSKK